MAIKNKIKISGETLLFIVGSILLIISFILFHYEKIIEVKNELNSAIQSEIYKESTSNNSNNISVSVTVDYIEEEKNTKPNYIESKPNYIAFLEIDKINLKQGLLPKTSYYNQVNYHVAILEPSDFPDQINGNFILAGHSGSGSIAYFRNLYKLEKGDIAKVYYQSKVYKYSIVNIYLEDKDGSINIYRDLNKTTLTLITCTKDDKKHQTVYILELIGVESY